MLLGWFDTKEAEEFGSYLASHYHEKTHANEKAKNRKIDEKQQKLGKEVLTLALQFKSKHSLNFLKKAKLGNAFKWKLIDLGYDKQLVDQLTRDVLLALR